MVAAGKVQVWAPFVRISPADFRTPVRIITMSHADETLRLWHKIGWVNTVCERWEEYFGSLIDHPERAEALSAQGLKALSGAAIVREAGSMSRVAIRHAPAPALVPEQRAWGQSTVYPELLSPVVERGLRDMLLGTEPRHRQPTTREPLKPPPPLGELRGTR